MFVKAAKSLPAVEADALGLPFVPNESVVGQDTKQLEVRAQESQLQIDVLMDLSQEVQCALCTRARHYIPVQARVDAVLRLAPPRLPKVDEVRASSHGVHAPRRREVAIPAQK